MPYYRSVGDVPRKRHTQFRQPDGTLYAEELVGQEGFSSDSSLLYHRHAPTAILAAEEYAPPTVTRMPNLPLKPRHLRTHKLDGTGADPVLGRQYLLANDDVRIAYVLADRPSPLFRDATGDHCLYLEAGSMRVESPFGVLDAVAGAYVGLPPAANPRHVPPGAAPAPLTPNSPCIPQVPGRTNRWIQCCCATPAWSSAASSPTPPARRSRS